jgi:cysteinyl-tRNA synthetase
MHVGAVRLDGARMAKSTGNLVLVSDVLAEHAAAALRLLLVDRPWGRTWDYRGEDLDAAAGRLERLYAAAARGAGAGGAAASAAVTDALLADLDVPAALDVAEEAGGDAARLALSVLNLS